MKVLSLIRIACCQAYCAWAEWDMHPAHPKRGEVVLLRHQLAEEERRLFA